MKTPRSRALLTSRIVQIVGAIEIVAMAVVGIIMMTFVDPPCIRESSFSDFCYQYGYKWDTAEWATGLVLMCSGLVFGTLLVMLGSYVEFRTKSESQ